MADHHGASTVTRVLRLNRRGRNMALRRFIRTEAGSGAVLFAAALAAVIWANSGWSVLHASFWHHEISFDLGVLAIRKDVQHWVNDGLMTIFFFVIGIEIKREVVKGALSSVRRAALPVVAALGGMIAPAALYLALNHGGPGSAGWGIPMATDIAFALGVLALLGKRVPPGLRVFLLALAAADDVGAIMVIALFYTSKVSGIALVVAAALLGFVLLMRKSEVRSFGAYLIVGLAFWLAVLMTGIHPTIAGVILGLLTPAVAPVSARAVANQAETIMDRLRRALARDDSHNAERAVGELAVLLRRAEAPTEQLERRLHPWVAFLVMPIFALANAGVEISLGQLRAAFTSPVTLGIVLGLVVGKLVGISAFSWVAWKIRAAELPVGVSWPQLAGCGLVAGIGFTVSLFITGLAFTDDLVVAEAKLGVLTASLVAGVAGFIVLAMFSGRRKADPADTEAPLGVVHRA
jgi:NhaA family Na+:H+ antiporter